MTPEEAYEKRYAHIDNGQHTWDAAPAHVKEMWLAAWAMAESGERAACAAMCDPGDMEVEEWERLSDYRQGLSDGAGFCAEAIRARGEK